MNAEVRFIVVGGAAAALHRKPVTTLGVDIAHERSPGNVQRLLEVLSALTGSASRVRVEASAVGSENLLDAVGSAPGGAAPTVSRAGR